MTVPDVAAPSDPTADLLLSGARTAAGDRVDVLVRDGLVHAVAPAGLGGSAGPAPTVDLDGYVLLPAPAEPHTHLDKALTWETLATGHVELPAAIEAWGRASSRLDPAETRDRALRAVTEMVAHGVTAVRTHVDVCPGDRPLAAVEAVAGLRPATAGVIDLQIAFLCRASTPDDVIRQAVEAGADLIGGAPYMEADPPAEHARLLRLASELSVGVDLHVDEEMDPAVASLGDLARRVRDGGFPHDVTASHCVSLGVQDPALVADVIAATVEAGIRVVTLPLTNLYLMGRGWPTCPPRGLTAVRRLLEAGVPVAAGGDNLRDPFNPMGRADPLAIASLLVNVAHLTVTEAYHAVSGAARQVIGLPAAGVAPGLVADLLAVRAASLDDALARTPDDRVVLRRGRVVAATETSRRTSLDRSYTNP